MARNSRQAPGHPGIDLPWTSGAKTAVGTSADMTGRVWFTIADGILTEIYYPIIDQACTRDSGFVITDGHRFCSDEATGCRHEPSPLAAGGSAYRVVNTCFQGRYRLEKRIITDPDHAAVIQQVRLERLEPGDLQLFWLVSPRLKNHSSGNTAWLGDYEGHQLLFAWREDTALALGCSSPWLARSVGFMGTSDSGIDLREHGHMTRQYDRAEDGAVSLAGQIEIPHGDSPFTCVIGFGPDPREAADKTIAALGREFDALVQRYEDGWRRWDRRLEPLDEQVPARLYRTSCRLLRTHEDKISPGGLIASLSIPWGFARGEDHERGYHLVWSRDLVKAGTALLAAGAREEGRRVLEYLRTTQRANGRWPQNMTLDGRPHWPSDQMDETALPVLLVDLALRNGALGEDEEAGFWPMVRAAALYLVTRGPSTLEDRWENAPGYATWTTAIEVAALLVAAGLADRCGEHHLASRLRGIADHWNALIDEWAYATGTQLARSIGVEGYYVRLVPRSPGSGQPDPAGTIHVKSGSHTVPAREMVSPDVLALVRYGLRAPDDPRILNTLRVVDATLRVETPFGPAWRRYSHDGYGEHEDGRHFDGTGVGRAWPLLTGERAHYELAAGDRPRALDLLGAMEGFANTCGMLPEQVWDADDIPGHRLFRGRPTGSAMPLVWSHAEYVTLCRSLRDGKVFDCPPPALHRYLGAG
jgi:glucoamylase